MSSKLIFEVNNQVITRKDSFHVVAKSINYLDAEFQFKTNEWQGDIFAIFGSIYGIYRIKLVNNKCTVPWECLQGAGKIYVSVYCGERVTANKAMVAVYESGFRSNTSPSEPTRDAYAELLEEMDKKVDKVTGKGLSTNDYTDSAKAKVDAIPSNPKYTDTVYDDTALKNRVQTIESKEASWDAKVDNVEGKGLSSNDYTDSAKAKVDGIPSNPKYTDTVYDDTALKARVSTIEGKESTWDGKANVDDIPSVSISDNTGGGIDISVDGTTKTVAAETEVTQIKRGLSSKVGYAVSEDGKIKMYSDSTKTTLICESDLPQGFSGNYNDLTNKLVAGYGIEIDSSNKIKVSLSSAEGVEF